MAEYRLTDDPDAVVLVSTEPNSDASITKLPDGNDGWAEYEQWLEDGGVPDPYVEPKPPVPRPPAPSPEDQVLYDHENRLRIIEGEPPLTLGEFLTKAQGK
jgi:hypothetical protein